MSEIAPVALIEERLETIQELSDLIIVVQEMGHRLAYETHGDHYAEVRELNNILHAARQKIAEIQRNSLDHR